MGYIYLITNTVTGKKYVGQTLCKDIESRWKQHRNVDKSCIGRYLLNAYKKHGIDKFKFQIICICFDEDTNIYEEQYIQKYNCIVPNGYNLKAGGKNSKHHPETIKKMSESLKGRILGTKTESTFQKLRESKLGERNPNFGKKMTDEQKKKISDFMKKRHRDINNLSTKQLEGLEKGRGQSKKPVGKYDTQGHLIKTYDSSVEASIANNICCSSIRRVCNGHKSYKTAGGFIWKYLPKENTPT